MAVPKLAGLIALLGFVLLIFTAIFGAAHFHVPNLDDWLTGASEFSLVLAVCLFLVWFSFEFIKEVRGVLDGISSQAF